MLGSEREAADERSGRKARSSGEVSFGAFMAREVLNVLLLLLLSFGAERAARRRWWDGAGARIAEEYSAGPVMWRFRFGTAEKGEKSRRGMRARAVGRDIFAVFLLVVVVVR